MAKKKKVTKPAAKKKESKTDVQKRTKFGQPLSNRFCGQPVGEDIQPYGGRCED